MNFHFGKEESSGNEHLTITRSAGDTDETMEGFAKSLKGTVVHMTRRADANGKVTLDEIVMNLG